MAGLSRLFAPREREFFDLFEEAGRNIVQSGDILERMLDRWPDHGELAREIVICEQEGDRITHDIIQRLNQTFVTPIEREDILDLASALDDIVDFIEEVADYLALYRIEAPMEQAQELVADPPPGLPRGEQRDPAPAHVRGHPPLHGRDQPAGERRRPQGPRGARRRCSSTGSTR